MEGVAAIRAIPQIATEVTQEKSCSGLQRVALTDYSHVIERLPCVAEIAVAKRARTRGEARSALAAGA